MWKRAPLSTASAPLHPLGAADAQPDCDDLAMLQRLFPGPAGPTTFEEAYLVERPRLAWRPWVGLCMITSIDGATAVSGRSGGLANASDKLVFRTIRQAADVVIVGANTAAGEGYRQPGKPGLRIGVVTNSAHLDWGSPL